MHPENCCQCRFMGTNHSWGLSGAGRSFLYTEAPRVHPGPSEASLCSHAFCPSAPPSCFADGKTEATIKELLFPDYEMTSIRNHHFLVAPRYQSGASEPLLDYVACPSGLSETLLCSSSSFVPVSSHSLLAGSFHQYLNMPSHPGLENRPGVKKTLL